MDNERINKIYLMDEDKNIHIYEIIFDLQRLKKYRTKHKDDIKVVKLHVYDNETLDILFTDNSIFFNMLDSKCKNGYINRIEEIDDEDIINCYIDGMCDMEPLINIISSSVLSKSSYSDIDIKDYVLVGLGGVRKGLEFITDKKIILCDNLAEAQPVIHGDLTEMTLVDYDLLDREFFNMIKVRKKGVIKEELLKMLFNDDLIKKDKFFDTQIYQSKRLYKKLKDYGRIK